MRVGVVLEQLQRSASGGTGRFTREITAALAAQCRPGDSVTGWSTGVGAWPVRRGNQRPHVAGTTTRSLVVPAPLLPRLWERGRGPLPRGADVVFAPTVLAPPRRPHGPAVVATIHDVVPWTAPQTMTPRGLAFHRRMIERIAREADAVVVPTEAVAAQLTCHVPQLQADRVHVIGEGVAAATSTPTDGGRRGGPVDLPPAYLLMVGTFEPRKGIDVAIAAMTDPVMPDLPLLLVGQVGWGGTDPRRLAAQQGLPDGRVRVLADIDDEALAVVYARASAVLVPSRDEGFGLPVAEAMAHGTPVVITDVPALVETAGGAAEVVPVGDARALAAAAARAAEPAYRTAQAGALRVAAGRHSWPAAAERLWTVLRSVATTPSQP